MEGLVGAKDNKSSSFCLPNMGAKGAVSDETPAVLREEAIFSKTTSTPHTNPQALPEGDKDITSLCRPLNDKKRDYS